MGIYRIPHIRKGKIDKPLEQYNYLLGKNVKEIILFDDSKEDEDNTNKIILPRHHSVFVGNKDGEMQFKPYEYNPNRIVVSTYKDIIISIDSIG